MTFVQLIEFRTSRLDEFNATLDEWIARSDGWRAPTRAMQCRDRDNPGRYVHIVEFPSYEEAMDNSARPETAAFAKRLAGLCDGEPVFRNLDVVRDDRMARSGTWAPGDPSETPQEMIAELEAPG